MLLIEGICLIFFIIFLFIAVYMVYTFYVCDSHTCKPYKQAEMKGSPGTKTYTMALLNELYNDGIWPYPYIGATIIAPIILWFVEMELTMKNFAIIFFVSFVVIYFLFSFFGHHYLRIIANSASQYIDDNVCFIE